MEFFIHVVRTYSVCLPRCPAGTIGHFISAVEKNPDPETRSSIVKDSRFKFDYLFTCSQKISAWKVSSGGPGSKISSLKQNSVFDVGRGTFPRSPPDPVSSFLVTATVQMATWAKSSTPREHDGEQQLRLIIVVPRVEIAIERSGKKRRRRRRRRRRRKETPEPPFIIMGLDCKWNLCYVCSGPLFLLLPIVHLVHILFLLSLPT